MGLLKQSLFEAQEESHSRQVTPVEAADGALLDRVLESCTCLFVSVAIGIPALFRFPRVSRKSISCGFIRAVRMVHLVLGHYGSYQKHRSCRSSYLLCHFRRTFRPIANI